MLTKHTVEGIQLQGGTILGTSRGGANIREIVKRLDMWGVDMLFVVGGNGGNAGANAIQEMCAKENVICAVVGIPKSIDNDILLVRSALNAGFGVPAPVLEYLWLLWHVFDRCGMHATVVACLRPLWHTCGCCAMCALYV